MIVAQVKARQTLTELKDPFSLDSYNPYSRTDAVGLLRRLGWW